MVGGLLILVAAVAGCGADEPAVPPGELRIATGFYRLGIWDEMIREFNGQVAKG